MYYDLPAWFWITSVSILGLLIGSFLNVVILRKPAALEHEWLDQALNHLKERFGDHFEPTAEMQTAQAAHAPSLVVDRSHCPNCGYKLKAWHNVPVLSYVMLRGRCAGCQKPISMQYPLVELLTAGLTLACYFRFGISVQGVAAMVLTWWLIALAGIDFRTQLLPDDYTYPLLWLGLILACFGVFVGPVPAIAGAAAGYLSLWSVYWLFKLTTGKEGMGYGDFKLLAALGAWTGVASVLLIVLLSAAVGAVVGLVLVAMRKHRGEVPMPFGPFLAAAGFIALLFGPQLIAQYLRLSGMQV